MQEAEAQFGRGTGGDEPQPEVGIGEARLVQEGQILDPAPPEAEDVAPANHVVEVELDIIGDAGDRRHRLAQIGQAVDRAEIGGAATVRGDVADAVQPGEGGVARLGPALPAARLEAAIDNQPAAVGRPEGCRPCRGAPGLAGRGQRAGQRRRGNRQRGQHEHESCQQGEDRCAQPRTRRCRDPIFVRPLHCPTPRSDSMAEWHIICLRMSTVSGPRAPGPRPVARMLTAAVGHGRAMQRRRDGGGEPQADRHRAGVARADAA